MFRHYSIRIGAKRRAWLLLNKPADYLQRLLEYLRVQIDSGDDARRSLHLPGRARDGDSGSRVGRVSGFVMKEAQPQYRLPCARCEAVTAFDPDKKAGGEAGDKVGSA